MFFFNGKFRSGGEVALLIYDQTILNICFECVWLLVWVNLMALKQPGMRINMNRLKNNT